MDEFRMKTSFLVIMKYRPAASEGRRQPTPSGAGAYPDVAGPPRGPYVLGSITSAGTARRIVGRGGFRTALALVLVALAAPLAAAPCPAPGSPEPSRISALYDGRQTPDPRDSNLHRLAEAPLNRMGYRLDYLDVSEPRPTTPLGDDVAAVISWLDAPVADPETFAEWVTALRRSCGEPPQHIVLGTPAVPLNGAPGAAAAQYLALAGVANLGPERAVTPTARTAAADPGMIGREATFLPNGGAVASLSATGGATSHLSLLPAGGEGDTPIDLAVTAPTGGYAAHGALVSYDARLGDPLWILDPFAFFETILGDAPRPVADVTTLYGRRVFFATVQSDGWLSLAPARRLGETGAMAASLLLRDLIAPFPTIPVTVAVLSGDLVPQIAGPRAPRGEEAARAIFALPHVRPATNGHDLVRDWARLHARTGDPVEVGDADTFVTAEGEPVLYSAFRALGGVFDPQAGRQSGATVRKYAAQPFDADREIGDALKLASEIAGEDETPALFLWPAGAQPTAQEFDLLDEVGALGFGGGPVPSMPQVPHLSALHPVISPDGRQVLEAFPPDLSFTRSWTAPPGALHGLRRTLDWTETPRRLTPFHLAYSAYSAQGFDSRSAIAGALAEVRDGDAYHVIAAADYAGIAAGFRTLRAERATPDSWRIKDRGALQTLRVDHAADLVLDIDASEGVLGARRKGDSLYLALDPGTPEPLLALAPGSAPSGLAEGARRPALIESGVALRAGPAEGCTSSYLVSGRADARLSFLLPPGQSLLKPPEGTPLPIALVETPGDGTVVLRIAPEQDGARDFEITFTCEAS